MYRRFHFLYLSHDTVHFPPRFAPFAFPGWNMYDRTNLCLANVVTWVGLDFRVIITSVTNNNLNLNIVVYLLYVRQTAFFNDISVEINQNNIKEKVK